MQTWLFNENLTPYSSPISRFITLPLTLIAWTSSTHTVPVTTPEESSGYVCVWGHDIVYDRRTSYWHMHGAVQDDCCVSSHPGYRVRDLRANRSRRLWKRQNRDIAQYVPIQVISCKDLATLCCSHGAHEWWNPSESCLVRSLCLNKPGRIRGWKALSFGLHVFSYNHATRNRSFSQTKLSAPY